MSQPQNDQHHKHHHEEKQRKQAVKRERWALLRTFIRLTEQPMIILAFVWLVLLIIDFSIGLNKPLTILSTVIWLLFGINFFLQLIVAPKKLFFLKRNWITAVSIVLPAVQLLSIFRAFQFISLLSAGKTLNMLRLLTSVRRGTHALSRTIKRRKLSYVFSLTVLIIFTGAAGMYNFENPQTLQSLGYATTRQLGLHSYPDALWWTAMIMTTMGSEYWPHSAAGRVLGFLLACYSSVVYGYLTASFASHFIHNDANVATKPASSAQKQGYRDASQQNPSGSAAP